MKFRRLEIDAVSTCINYGYDRAEWVSLRFASNVIGWHLSEHGKQSGLNFQDFNTIRLIGMDRHECGPFSISENTAYVRVPLESPSRLTSQTERSAKFSLLEELLEDGLRGLERHHPICLSTFRTAISDLKDQEYRTTKILAERRPRKLGLTVRLEATMSYEALVVDFVALQDQHELFRDTIYQDLPFETWLKGKFKKIEFDGKRFWVPGQVPMPIPDANTPIVSTAQQTELYEWSKSLESVLDTHS